MKKLAHEHSVIDLRVEFLAAVKILPRDFNRHVTCSKFAHAVSEPYDNLNKTILERGRQPTSGVL